MRIASRGRLLLAAVLVVLVCGFFALGLHRDESLGALQAHRVWLLSVCKSHPVLAPVAYGLAYAGIAALTLPLNIPLSLGAGALFGLAEGVVLVSFASACGATLSFLSSRILFRDVVQARFGGRLRDVEAGIARNGVFYLLSLRLAPVVPYTMVNLLFGLTAIPVTRFYWVTQLGTLPATLIYVNAGTRLESLQSLSGIVSPGVLVSLLLLAGVPLVARVVATRVAAFSA